MLTWKRLALLLACCAATIPLTGARTPLPPYVVGAVLSLTGANAPLGVPERDMLLALRDEINAGGGISGRQLQLVIEDDQSDNTHAVLAAKKLIDVDRVSAIIGASATGPTLAIIPLLEASGVALLSLAGGASITKPVQRFVFRTQVTSALAATATTAALQRRGYTRIGILYQNDATGTAERDALRAAAADRGIQITSEQTYYASDTDVSAQLAAMRKANVQAIVCHGFMPGVLAVARGVQQLGPGQPLFLGPAAATQGYLAGGSAVAGPRLAGGRHLVISEIPAGDPQKQALLRFAKLYESRFRAPPTDPYAASAYDALQIVVAALRRAGDDRARLRDAIESTTGHAGVLGVYTFRPTDHDGLGEDALIGVGADGARWKLIREDKIQTLPTR